MIPEDWLTKRGRFAIEKHEQQNQMYGDKPYVHHLRSVAELTMKINKDDKYLDILMELAWTHDLVEDCEDVNFDLLIGKGWTIILVEAIDAISKRPCETRKEYLQRCMANPYAHKVKIADTLSNLTESVKDGNVRRISKYTKQLNVLHKTSC